MQQGRNCGLLMFQTADVSDCFFLWLHLCSFVYCCIRLFSCSLVFLWALDVFLLELTDWNGFYGGGAQLFKSFLLLYIQGVLVGVLGSADIYSQFKLIIPPEVRSYFLLIVPWLDGLCVRVCIRWRWHKYLKWCEFVKKTYVEKRRIGGVRVHEGQGHN